MSSIRSVSTDLRGILAICPDFSDKENVQAELFNFLLKDKKDKIKRLLMYQPFAEGGLNFVNFPAVVKRLRLAWINRFLSTSRDPWKAIPNHYLSTHGGLQFPLTCNYNAACINNGFLTFYSRAFTVLKNLRTRLKYSRMATSCSGRVKQ